MVYGLQTHADIIAKEHREGDLADPPSLRVVNYFPFDHTVLLNDGRRITAEQWEHMLENNYGPGGGGGGGSMYIHGNQYGSLSPSTYLSSSMAYDSTYQTSYSGYSTIMRGFPAQKLKDGKEMKEEEKRRRIEERMREEHLAKRTLADLSDESKVKFMKIVRDTYNQYKYEQEVNQIMSGLKWLLFFLGLAILWNFGHILNIIQTVVTK